MANLQDQKMTRILAATGMLTLCLVNASVAQEVKPRAAAARERIQTQKEQPIRRGIAQRSLMQRIMDVFVPPSEARSTSDLQAERQLQEDAAATNGQDQGRDRRSQSESDSAGFRRHQSRSRSHTPRYQQAEGPADEATSNGTSGTSQRRQGDRFGRQHAGPDGLDQPNSRPALPVPNGGTPDNLNDHQNSDFPAENSQPHVSQPNNHHAPSQGTHNTPEQGNGSNSSEPSTRIPRSNNGDVFVIDPDPIPDGDVPNEQSAPSESNGTIENDSTNESPRHPVERTETDDPGTANQRPRDDWRGDLERIERDSQSTEESRQPDQGSNRESQERDSGNSAEQSNATRETPSRETPSENGPTSPAEMPRDENRMPQEQQQNQGGEPEATESLPEESERQDSSQNDQNMPEESSNTAAGEADRTAQETVNNESSSGEGNSRQEELVNVLRRLLGAQPPENTPTLNDSEQSTTDDNLLDTLRRLAREQEGWDNPDSIESEENREEEENATDETENISAEDDEAIDRESNDGGRPSGAVQRLRRPDGNYWYDQYGNLISGPQGTRLTHTPQAPGRSPQPQYPTSTTNMRQLPMQLYNQVVGSVNNSNGSTGSSNRTSSGTTTRQPSNTTSIEFVDDHDPIRATPAARTPRFNGSSSNAQTYVANESAQTASSNVRIPQTNALQPQTNVTNQPRTSNQLMTRRFPTNATRQPSPAQQNYGTQLQTRQRPQANSGTFANRLRNHSNVNRNQRVQSAPRTNAGSFANRLRNHSAVNQTQRVQTAPRTTNRTNSGSFANRLRNQSQTNRTPSGRTAVRSNSGSVANRLRSHAGAGRTPNGVAQPRANGRSFAERLQSRSQAGSNGGATRRNLTTPNVTRRSRGQRSRTAQSNNGAPARQLTTPTVSRRERGQRSRTAMAHP